MTRRNVVFLAASAFLAVLFVRLGIWQLDRLAGRRARNAVEARRLAAPPVPLTALPADPAQANFRRVQIAGQYDFGHQLVYVNRIRDGAPGVHLITPLHPDAGPGGDTLVLVDRGWVYSPDGATVDEQRWREPERLDASGYVQPLVASRTGAGSASLAGDHPSRLRRLDRATIAARVGHPVAPYYVVLSADTTGGAPAGPVRTPVRMPPPALDDGPHLSYAIQWFSFAVIAIVGSIVVVFVLPRQSL